MLFALPSGCSSSHDVDLAADASTRADSSEGLCARLVAIQCDAEQRCCSAGARSRERCRAEVQQACDEDVFLDQVAQSPQSGFDPTAADRVFAELERLSLRCDVSLVSWAVSEEGLQSMFRGTLARDQSCSPVGGVTSERAVIASALAACRRDDGLACLPQGLLGEWTCAPKQAEGQSCITDDNCEVGAACDNYAQTSLGSCVARLPLGAACTDAGQCQSLFCDDGVCAEWDAMSVYCPPE